MAADNGPFIQGQKYKLPTKDICAVYVGTPNGGNPEFKIDISAVLDELTPCKEEGDAAAAADADAAANVAQPTLSPKKGSKAAALNASAPAAEAAAPPAAPVNKKGNIPKKTAPTNTSATALAKAPAPVNANANASAPTNANENAKASAPANANANVNASAPANANANTNTNEDPEDTEDTDPAPAPAPAPAPMPGLKGYKVTISPEFFLKLFPNSKGERIRDARFTPVYIIPKDITLNPTDSKSGTVNTREIVVTFNNTQKIIKTAKVFLDRTMAVIVGGTKPVFGWGGRRRTRRTHRSVKKRKTKSRR